MTEPPRVPSLLVSDLVVSDWLGDIEVDGFKGVTKLSTAALRANDTDAQAQRFELLNHVKAGKHLELQVAAQTFAQTKKPNRRYLRLAEDKLEARAPSWRGQPYLKDHNTWSMSSQMGTLTTSKAEAIDGGMTFQQKLNATATESVIGILDGRWTKFSIGWWPKGPVLCSVHNCDVAKLDGCNCWPGDKVTMTDGRERIVEFIFTDFQGKETSSVVIPAVQDTHVDEVRAALAAELGMVARRTLVGPPIDDIRGQRPRMGREHDNKENGMNWTRLAALLGVAALGDGDEDRAIAAVQALTTRATTAETTLASVRTELQQAQAAVRTLTATSVGIQIDAALNEHGYRAGKLKHGRDSNGVATASVMEGFLRKLAASEGVAGLTAALAELPVIVPVNERLQSERTTAPDRVELDADSWLTTENPYLQSAASQLGQKVEDLVAYGKGHVNWETA